MEKILVTGATGTVGSLLVKELLARGLSVRACAHSPKGLEKIAKNPNVERVQMEFNDEDSLKKAFSGVTRAYLLTPAVKEQPHMVERCVRTASREGVRHIVRQSAMGAGMEPGAELLSLHAKAEEIIEGSGIDYTILRPNAFMQNFTTYFGAEIRLSGTISAPLGSSKVSYVDCRDIAASAAVALSGKELIGRTLELTGSEPLSLSDVSGILSSETGRRIKHEDINEDDALRAMKLSGQSDWMARSLVELFSLWRSGAFATATNGVREITGKNPRTFKEYARDYKDGFLAQVKKAV